MTKLKWFFDFLKFRNFKGNNNKSKQRQEVQIKQNKVKITHNNKTRFSDLFQRVKKVSFKREQELDKAKALRQEILATYRVILNNMTSNQPSFLHSCIPLEDQDPIDVDRTQLITYTLKIRPNGANDHTYKKALKLFSTGSVTDWIETVKDINEVWTQNSVGGPHDRAAIVKTILRDEALSHFEVALEVLRQGPNGERLEFTADLVNKALEYVSLAIFPHRALETQKQWMRRHMKKPMKMRYRLFQARVLKINKYLPYFPGANEDSKFSSSDILEMLEFSLPDVWRQEWDKKGYIPTNHTLEKLIQEAEAMERSEDEGKKIVEKERKRKRENKNRNNQGGRSNVVNKKTKKQKYCKEHGLGNHDSSECWTLHPEKKPEKFQMAKVTKETEKKAKKPGKEMLQTSLKQKIPKKAKKAKKIAKPEESDSDYSVNHMEEDTAEEEDSKEERAQRYQAKLAKNAAQDSDSE